MSIIDKIIMLLEQKEKTQKELTDYLGLEKSTFSAWKSGKSKSYSKHISKIAEFLSVSPDYLLRDSISLDFSPHENDEYILKCPMCEYDYVHFSRIIDVDFDSTKSSGLAIEFFCESNHKFYMVIETYKGNTYMVTVDEHGLNHTVTDIEFDNIPISLAELWVRNENANFAKKYRTLDEYSKKVVDSVLDLEYERCSAPPTGEPNIIHLPKSVLKASAGTGNWLDEQQLESVSVVDTPQTKKANLIIEVDGDSMEPLYKNGDNVLVNTRAEAVVGDIGIFIVDGNGYIKKLGDNRLISVNPEYDDIFPTEYSDFRCVGKVLGKAEIIE